MPTFSGKPERKDSSGRVPDAVADSYQKYVNDRYTCPPELHARLVKFYEDEERAKS